MVREICNKHRITYIKVNVFIWLKKGVDIMMGISSMRQFPAVYESKFLDLKAQGKLLKTRAVGKH